MTRHDRRIRGATTALLLSVLGGVAVAALVWLADLRRQLMEMRRWLVMG
jgi:hypothetical protein